MRVNLITTQLASFVVIIARLVNEFLCFRRFLHSTYIHVPPIHRYSGLTQKNEVIQTTNALLLMSYDFYIYKPLLQEVLSCYLKHFQLKIVRSFR